jgi:hypothetical protein
MLVNIYINYCYNSFIIRYLEIVRSNVLRLKNKKSNQMIIFFCSRSYDTVIKSISST